MITHVQTLYLRRCTFMKGLRPRRCCSRVAISGLFVATQTSKIPLFLIRKTWSVTKRPLHFLCASYPLRDMRRGAEAQRRRAASVRGYNKVVLYYQGSIVKQKGWSLAFNSVSGEKVFFGTILSA